MRLQSSRGKRKQRIGLPRLSRDAFEPGDHVLRLGLSTIALIAVGLLAEPAHAQSARTPRKPKSVAAARPSSPPSADSLSSITRRGRTLAIRDSIASLGAAAMTSFAVPADSIVRLIVRRSGRGWEVVSGRLSDDQTIFLVTEVSIPGIEPKRWASTTFDPASVDTGYFANAARAIESSITMFRRSSPHTYVELRRNIVIELSIARAALAK